MLSFLLFYIFSCLLSFFYFLLFNYYVNRTSSPYDGLMVIPIGFVFTPFINVILIFITMIVLILHIFDRIMNTEPFTKINNWFCNLGKSN